MALAPPVLLVAAERNNIDGLRSELRKDPGLLDKQLYFGRTALMEAASQGHKESVDFLLQQGAAVNLQDRAGQTALHLAALSGHVECVDSLLEAGALPGQRTNSGLNCLMGASGAGRYAVVQRLLEHGGQGIDDTDEAGQTALWRACFHNYDGRIALALLVHGGADPSIPDLQEGLTAREIAVRRGRHACVKAIEWYEQESGRIYYLQKARQLRSLELLRERFGLMAPLPSYLRRGVHEPLPLVTSLASGEEEADATFEFVVEQLGPELYVELMRGLWRTCG